MYSSPEQKANCPLKISYISFGDSHLASAHNDQDQITEMFSSASDIPNLDTACAKAKGCDHTVCKYKQEVVDVLKSPVPVVNIIYHGNTKE